MGICRPQQPFFLFPAKQASRGPIICHSEPRSGEESPAYQKTKPNGRSVIAPANIHERDSELAGAVIDRPQTMRKGEGRRFFVTLFLRMTALEWQQLPAKIPFHGNLQTAAAILPFP